MQQNHNNPFSRPPENYYGTPPQANEWANLSMETETPRESLINKIKRRVGEAAATLSGVITGNRANQAFGRAENIVGRADTLLNSNAANMLSYTPGIGRHVNTARNAVGIAQSTLEVAGNARNIANSIHQQGASQFTKDILKQGAVGALDSLNDQVGVSIDRQSDHNKLKVNKGKLARFALRLATSGGVGELASTGTEALRAGVDSAKYAAFNSPSTPNNYQPNYNTPFNAPPAQNNSNYNTPFSTPPTPGYNYNTVASQAYTPNYNSWQQPIATTNSYPTQPTYR